MQDERVARRFAHSDLNEGGVDGRIPCMSKAEILEELPKLSVQDRADILERLWKLEESAGPTSREKILLEEAQVRYDANPAAGCSWSETETRLRKRA